VTLLRVVVLAPAYQPLARLGRLWLLPLVARYLYLESCLFLQVYTLDIEYNTTLSHQAVLPAIGFPTMRLLRRNANGNFSLTEFIGDTIPPYAILSHTWGADGEEVSFKDVTEGTAWTKAGYRKIQFCGDQAVKDDLQYFWIDTCCIDKSSSAELSEAINSMFQWYRGATRCYVYLADVSSNDFSISNQSFQKSRWFTRGWTLQELIAPSCVDFFSSEGENIGDKASMVQEINNITSIPIKVLKGSPLSAVSVEERMSWAENRKTTRAEDAIYCLLGVFDIHMPLLYGEGRQKAYSRLRKEIKKPSAPTPLHWAASNGHLELVTLLIIHGADVSGVRHDGWTPLHEATAKGHLEIVKLLLSYGAHVSVASNDRWTPLHEAVRGSHLEIVKLLLENKADVLAARDDGWTPLQEAACNGHPRIVKLLLEHKADVSAVRFDGWTSLHLATSKNHLEVVTLLLDHGADVSAASNDKWTPLHEAARVSDLEIVQLLLENKADVLAARDDGLTPLHEAVRVGYLEIAMLLLNHGADVSAARHDGSTPLHDAARNGHLEIVKLLLKYKAEVSAARNDGLTPLQVATCNNHIDIVKLLLRDKETDVSVASVVSDLALDGLGPG
jgi:ankyrin repeat protein